MSFAALEWAYKQTAGGLVEKAVLLALANRVNNGNGECFPGIETIASDCEAGRRAIMRAIVRLEEHGFLKADRARGRATKYMLATAGRFQTSVLSDTSVQKDTRPVSKRTLDQCPKGHPNQESNQEGNQEVRPSPKTAKSAAQPPAAEELSDFNRFWLVYPRKDAKAKALQAWKKAKADNLVDLIIADVTRRRIDDQQWANPQYIPYPATYINQRRWEDEIATAAKPAHPSSPRLADILAESDRRASNAQH